MEAVLKRGSGHRPAPSPVSKVISNFRLLQFPFFLFNSISIILFGFLLVLRCYPQRLIKEVAKQRASFIHSSPSLTYSPIPVPLRAWAPVFHKGKEILKQNQI